MGLNEDLEDQIRKRTKREREKKNRINTTTTKKGKRTNINYLFIICYERGRRVNFKLKKNGVLKVVVIGGKEREREKKKKVSAVKHSKWLTFILIRAAIVNKIFVVFVLVIKKEKNIYKGENNKEINNLNYRNLLSYHLEKTQKVQIG